MSWFFGHITSVHVLSLKIQTWAGKILIIFLPVTHVTTRKCAQNFVAPSSKYTTNLITVTGKNYVF